MGPQQKGKVCAGSQETTSTLKAKAEAPLRNRSELVPPYAFPIHLYHPGAGAAPRVRPLYLRVYNR